jgi:hypothetical protein
MAKAQCTNEYRTNALLALRGSGGARSQQSGGMTTKDSSFAACCLR